MSTLHAWLVDDDDLILRALQRMLKRLYPNWKLSFFSEAALMLNALQQQDKPDLVICDRVMPEYSGEEVLTQVKFLAPKAIRTLLTADTCADLVISDCADIHHFLAKPFTDADFILVFSCVEQLAKLPINDQVRQELGHLTQLPVLPAIFHQLHRLLQQPDASTQQVATLIAQDAVLASKMLQIANSPLMGFSRKTVVLEEALVRLGFALIDSIAVGMFCEQALHKQLDAELHSSISQHSYHWAACARRLAMLCHIPARLQELAFMAALFTGLGTLLLAAQGRDCTLPASEQQWHQPQTDAVLISVYLLTLWGFDASIANVLLQLPTLNDTATSIALPNANAAPIKDDALLTALVLYFSQAYLLGQEPALVCPAELADGFQLLLQQERE